jgi:hypothetical protein
MLMTEASWVSYRGGFTISDANHRIRTAAQIDDHPLVAAAMAEGRIPVSVAEKVMAVATPDNEAELVELCGQATPSQVLRVASSYKKICQPDPPVPAEPNLTVTHETDNTMTIRGQLDVLDGAVLQKALQAARDQLRASGQIERPNNADGLNELAGHYLGCDQHTKINTRRDRYQVIIVSALETLARLAAAPRPRLLTGPAVPLPAVEALLSEVVVQGLITRDGDPLHLGRKTRLATDTIKKILAVRQPGCDYPGCEVPALHCDAHHQPAWAHGGRTDIETMANHCSRHHHAYHRGEFSIQAIGPGQFRYWLPDGTALIPTPRPPVEPILFPVADGATLPDWGGEHFTPYAMDVILNHLYQLDHPWPPPPAPPATDIETERGHDQTWQETPLFPADGGYPGSQN